MSCNRNSFRLISKTCNLIVSVTVPIEEIEHTEGMQLSQIELLKFFGAGSTEDEGYLVVPSGSGGIINFNNGKTREDTYTQAIYDTDLSTTSTTRTQAVEAARLPVYGINKGNNGLLAEVVQGDTVATVVADVSGKTNSYNYVYSRFKLRDTDKLQMDGLSGAESDMRVVENEMFDENIVIKYHFLANEGSYTAMANKYQDILIEQGVLTPLQEVANTPFYLDLIGGLEKEEFVVGVPYQGLAEMTTYKQAIELVDMLTSAGVSNIQLRYIGWFNGGINHDVATHIKPLSSLGSKADREALMNVVANTGGNFYPDVALQFTKQGSKNYNVSTEAARRLDGWDVTTENLDREILQYSAQYNAGKFSVVSANALPSIVGDFIKSYNKLGMDSVSLRDMGNTLNSDKRKKYPINREESKEIIKEQLGILNETYSNIMLAGGNAYALGFADHLIDVPSTGNKYYIIDEIIPFYETVIHGYVDYTGVASNMTEGYDKDTQLLRMLEFGLAPHYLWSYGDSSLTNYSAYEDYYSTNYEQWFDDAVESYTVVNGIYQDQRTAKIVDHIIHEHNVRETVYDTGVSIIVNYNNQAVNVNGVTVEAKGYVVKGAAK